MIQLFLPLFFLLNKLLSITIPRHGWTLIRWYYNSLVSDVTDISEATEVFLDGPKKRNKGKDYKILICSNLNT